MNTTSNFAQSRMHAHLLLVCVRAGCVAPLCNE